MNETSASLTPPAAIDTIGPGELTALVARLHERNEAMTTADVAAALGLPESEVADALRDLRAARPLPPLVGAATARPPSAFARRRPNAALLALPLLLASLLVGGAIFAVGRAELRSAPASRASSEDSLSERLRTILPPGMTVRVGEVAYTGRPGETWGDESELAEAIEALLNERRATPTSDPKAEETLSVNWKDETFPVVTRPLRESEGGGTEEGRTALIRHDAARIAANRLAEWAETLRKR